MLVPDVPLMRHDWIYDVLADLAVYARINGLTATAIKAEEALAVARAEIALVDPDGGPGGDAPPDGGGRPN